jgi:hypothetical protein
VHKHELSVIEAKNAVETAEKRLEELQGQDGDLRPSETKELMNLHREIRRSRERHAELEAATPFLGMTDDGVQDAFVDRAEETLKLFQEARQATRDRDFLAQTLHTDAEMAVVERRAKRAEAAYEEAIASQVEAKAEVERRALVTQYGRPEPENLNLGPDHEAWLKQRAERPPLEELREAATTAVKEDEAARDERASEINRRWMEAVP